GLRAASLLHQILHGEPPPRMALAKPPLIVNIMSHDTSCDPLASLFEELQNVDIAPGFWSASLLPGFAYADVPQMGPSVLVVGDRDSEAPEREAQRLGRRLWELREQLTRALPDPGAAVAMAFKASRSPVVLVDTGDNVGGGSAADGTVLLAEM